MPKIDTKTANSKSPEHIISFLTKNIDIDKILARASNAVFDLDARSYYILEKLAENGKLNINQIADRDLCDRFAVSRRINGVKSKDNLLGYDFVRIVESTEFRKTGKEEKTFSLSLKGALASLSSVKFENIKLVSDYYDELRDMSNNLPLLIELAILYAKFHIALELLWTKMNKLNYNEVSDFNEYFFEDSTNYRIQLGILGNTTDEDWKDYNLVLSRYSVLKHAIVMLIKKNYKKILPSLYKDKRVKHILDSLKREGQDPIKSFFVRYLIKDWALYLDLSTFSKKKKEFALVEYGSGINSKSINFDTYSIDATELYEKIRKPLGLKKSIVSTLSVLKYGKKT